MRRLEPALVGLFFASWTGALLDQLGLLSLAGTFGFGLYPLFSLAAALGWIAGNVYLHRRRRLASHRLRRRALVTWLFGPPGILYLLRQMAPAPEQQAAPLVPLLSFAVFTVFFLVPLTLGGEWSRPPEE
ncbi:MAG TPA: hypothetical protein VMT16_00525 [Thermoanaerobaculia bacterium]|nr:hypothetical protein [Thermoanaerobaculia bacterium]